MPGFQDCYDVVKNTLPRQALFHGYYNGIDHTLCNAVFPDHRKNIH
jgi:hypothetical protein